MERGLERLPDIDPFGGPNFKWENKDTPKHISEQAEKDEADYLSALKAHDILDKVVANFKPGRDVEFNAGNLRTRLELAGLNFNKPLGFRTLAKTRQFIINILRLKATNDDLGDIELPLDTTMALNRLAEDLNTPSILKDLDKKAAA